MSSNEYAIVPTPEIEAELAQRSESHDHLLREAMDYLDSSEVDGMSVARMYIERGFSEELAYWLVREAEVKRAPR